MSNNNGGTEPWHLVHKKTAMKVGEVGSQGAKVS